jgi:leucyl aminopeptidase
MGNDQKLVNELLDCSKKSDEYLWQLPIIPEFHNDMKSPIADLKNIGSNRFGGTSKAAAFLECFVKNEVKWAHLDIAGIADAQSHLPYCPSKGASGLMVRTLVRYLAQQ